MKLAGDVPLIIVTFLGTFYFTVWVGGSLLLVYYPPEWLILAVPTLFALLTAVFVWTRSASNGGTLGCGRRLGTGLWVWYLTTGAVLAILRVSMLAWVEYRSVSDQMTETVYNLLWSLRPELLLGEYTRVGAIQFSRAMQHFLFWASILALGSFIMATPILLVGWLRHRRTTS